MTCIMYYVSVVQEKSRKNNQIFLMNQCPIILTLLRSLIVGYMHCNLWFRNHVFPISIYLNFLSCIFGRCENNK